MADITQNRPVTPDTIFLWASVSKTITVTTLMQLYDKGRFLPDDDISRYIGFQVQIPSCPATPVTFRELLTHTSSIIDSDAINNSPIDVNSGDPTIPLADLVKGYLIPGGAFYDANANFSSGCPNTAYSYSNMGATTIGYLVQVMSGENLYQYYRDHIFTPLGMSPASFRLADFNPSEIAQIALPNGKGTLYGEADFPDGMLHTSPSNLAKFLIMYMQGGQYNGQQLLQAATVHMMLSPQTTLDKGDVAQGLIWYEDNGAGRNTWGHNGGDNGVSSDMFFDPVKNEGVLMVANGEWPGDADATLQRLFQEADIDTPPGPTVTPTPTTTVTPTPTTTGSLASLLAELQQIEQEITILLQEIQIELDHGSGTPSGSGSTTSTTQPSTPAPAPRPTPITCIGEFNCL